MGTIKCKKCPSTWTASTPKTETVIAQNHAYLHPGHRTVTVWEKPHEDSKASWVLEAATPHRGSALAIV